MKKVLSLVSSAALALAMMVPAPAMGQAAKKLSGSHGAARTATQVAKQAPAPAKGGIRMAPTRGANAAGEAVSLKKAMTGAGYLQSGKKSFKKLAEGADLPVFYGCVTFNDVLQGSDGLFKIEGPTTTKLFGGPKANYGGVAIDDLYYSIEFNDLFGFIQWVQIDAYDIESGELVASNDAGSVDNLSLGIATDPVTGTIYAITYNAAGDGLQLSTLNFGADCVVTTTAIAPIEGHWNSLVCDAEGQLYGIICDVTGEAISGSALCKIDKTTAAVTRIGDTGKVPTYLSSATIDTKTGRMFWNVCGPDETGILCEVNLTTGAATDLCTLEANDEIMGMYVPQPAAANGAPAIATDLAAEFPGGALSGAVKFKAPTTLFDGSAATGAITYSVLANGEAVGSGNTTFGAEVSVPVTLAQPGQYDFVVTTANAAGTSPKAKFSAFVGNGTPAATTATLTYQDGMMKLSWTPVTTTVEGGYIDAAAVTYKVTRFPGEVVVAENTTATTFSEPMAESGSLESVYYTVAAKAAGIEGAAAQSNAVSLGSIVPPYTNAFGVASDLDGFTIIDANNDGKTWSIYNGAARAIYNSSKDMDDWLITPGVKLEAGKLYKVTFEASSNGTSFPERIEAKWGTMASAAGMTETLVPATVLSSSVYVELGDYIVPTADGTYYIGLHGISDADMYYLYVRNLSISAPMAATVPAAATDLAITPDADGALKATVTVKAPTLDMKGDALSAISKVEVARDGVVVKTFDAPSAGATLTFEDTPSAAGTYTYTVVASNADGSGPEISASAYIGVKNPAAPANITMVEEGNTGKVTLTWDAVNTAFDGASLNPAYVKYLVCKSSNQQWVPFTEELSATTYTFQAVPEGEQDFVQFAVFAVTDGGNAGAAGPFAPVGAPYTDFEESFANGTLSYAWATGFSANSGSWSIFTDDKFEDIASCDGDNGFAAMNGQYLDSTSGLMSGKISLEGAVNPGVSFYTYNIVGESPDINEIQVYVKEPADADWTALGAPVVVKDIAEAEGWQLVNTSLVAYAGKTIQVRFQATTKQYVYTMLDGIKVGSLLGNDLAVKSINAPASVLGGADYTVDVIVANNGTLDAGEFTVELYADGTLADTKKVDALASGVKTTVAFDCTMSPVATEAVELHAVVKYAADENEANNTSATIEVAPKVSSLPKVTDLTGEQTAAGVKLTWSEPDISSAPVEPTEVDFEDGTAWAMEYAGWTFVDKDGAAVGGFQDSDIPGITPGETAASFFIFDSSNETVVGQFAQSFQAHSGDKYLAALFRFDDETTDDWAISPLLSGDAQTISFWARSYSAQYPETIEMYYSTSSTDPADFVKVGATVDAVPGEWTKYTFDVPAGAKHFAVRSCATGSFMLMLDDFTFAAAGGPSAELGIIGYDVYRDGVKITAEPVGETEFVDTNATDGTHSYVVVTVYTTGSSAPSNAVNVTFSGINDAMASGVSISTARGTITVAGAEGQHLTIAATDGKLIFSAVAGARETVAVATGVYIVKAGEKTVKVAVK